MNETDDELKTVAILTTQSPLALGSEEQWHRVAENLSSRLHHPVLFVSAKHPDELSQACEKSIAFYHDQGFRRFVLMPIGLEPFDHEVLFSLVVCLRSQQMRVNLHVGRSWSLQDVADAFGPPVMETLRSDRKSAVLLLANGASDRRTGLELASLAFHFQQVDKPANVHHAYLHGMNPSLGEVLQRLDRSGVQEVVLLTWRMDSDETAVAIRELGSLHGIELSAEPFDFAWKWNRLSAEGLQAMRLLEHPSWTHVAMGVYFDALSARSSERYIITDSKLPSEINFGEANGLAEIDRRVDSMLPTEYRGRLEQVSAKSMGSASIDSDCFGVVAWDEIWTSFCDLAMAGGPPHRGKLLEAITAEQAKENLAAYEAVVGEIRRGVEMVTGLSTLQSSIPGWVGVGCDDEAMAVWLMRAIIVENVMVRREGATLFLPAGPNFRVRKEIKNVITSVAKTVHYWRAHLRSNY